MGVRCATSFVDDGEAIAAGDVVGVLAGALVRDAGRSDGQDSGAGGSSDDGGRDDGVAGGPGAVAAGAVGDNEGRGVGSADGGGSGGRVGSAVVDAAKKTMPMLAVAPAGPTSKQALRFVTGSITLSASGNDPLPAHISLGA